MDLFQTLKSVNQCIHTVKKKKNSSVQYLSFDVSPENVSILQGHNKSFETNEKGRNHFSLDSTFQEPFDLLTLLDLQDETSEKNTAIESTINCKCIPNPDFQTINELKHIDDNTQVDASSSNQGANRFEIFVR